MKISGVESNRSLLYINLSVYEWVLCVCVCWSVKKKIFLLKTGISALKFSFQQMSKEKKKVDEVLPQSTDDRIDIGDELIKTIHRN